MRLTSLSISFALACAVGCGQDAPTSPRITPEPAAHPTTPTPPEEPAVTETPTPTPERIAETPPPEAEPEPLAIPSSPPLPAPPADPTHARVFSVADDFDYGDESDLSQDDSFDVRLFIPVGALRPADGRSIPVPMGHDSDPDTWLAIQYPQFHFANAHLERLVNERVASFARAQVNAQSPGVECTGFATLQLVSILCSGNAQSERTAYDVAAAGYAAMTLKIEDGEVRPMSIADALVPGTDVAALIAESCERYRQSEDGRMEFMDCPTAVPAHAAFGIEGITVGADVNPNEWTQPGALHISYDDIADKLLARGPLAESLYRRRARTREVTIDPSLRAAPPPTRAVWTIGPMASPGEAAALWMRIPIAQRDGVQLLEGYLVAPSAEPARAIATALGVQARERQVLTGSTPVAFHALQLTREAPLRAGTRRSAPTLRTLPRGALVAGLGDAVDGSTRVLASAEADGFVESRSLGPPDACSPDLAPVLPSLPEAARADAAAVTLRILTRQPGLVRAVYVTELGSTMHVELRAINETCGDDHLIARFDRPGAHLTYFGLSHTERGAGQALIVTTDDGEDAQLAVHAYEGGRSIYTAPLGEDRHVAVGRSEGDAWYPVVLLDGQGEQVDMLVWNGTTLAPPSAPEPSAPPP